MQVFEKAAQKDFCLRLMVQLKQAFPGRVPANDSELQASVEGWIGDARTWGFKTEGTITTYVLRQAETNGRREPIADRLQVFLRLYHEDLTDGVDLPAFAAALVVFATKHGVVMEEGVAWLAAVVLAGRNRGDLDLRWIEHILERSSLEEETRMHEVHRGAVTRGWVKG